MNIVLNPFSKTESEIHLPSIQRLGSGDCLSFQSISSDNSCAEGVSPKTEEQVKLLRDAREKGAAIILQRFAKKRVVNSEQKLVRVVNVIAKSVGDETKKTLLDSNKKLKAAKTNINKKSKIVPQLEKHLEAALRQNNTSLIKATVDKLEKAQREMVALNAEMIGLGGESNPDKRGEIGVIHALSRQLGVGSCEQEMRIEEALRKSIKEKGPFNAGDQYKAVGKRVAVVEQTQYLQKEWSKALEEVSSLKNRINTQIQSSKVDRLSAKFKQLSSKIDKEVEQFEKISHTKERALEKGKRAILEKIMAFQVELAKLKDNFLESFSDENGYLLGLDDIKALVAGREVGGEQPLFTARKLMDAVDKKAREMSERIPKIKKDADYLYIDVKLAKYHREFLVERERFMKDVGRAKFLLKDVEETEKLNGELTMLLSEHGQTMRSFPSGRKGMVNDITKKLTRSNKVLKSVKNVKVALRKLESYHEEKREKLKKYQLSRAYNAVLQVSTTLDEDDRTKLEDLLEEGARLDEATRSLERHMNMLKKDSVNRSDVGGNAA